MISSSIAVPAIFFVISPFSSVVVTAQFCEIFNFERDQMGISRRRPSKPSSPRQIGSVRSQHNESVDAEQVKHDTYLKGRGRTTRRQVNSVATCQTPHTKRDRKRERESCKKPSSKSRGWKKKSEIGAPVATQETSKVNNKKCSRAV